MLHLWNKIVSQYFLVTKTLVELVSVELVWANPKELVLKTVSFSRDIVPQFCT